MDDTTSPSGEGRRVPITSNNSGKSDSRPQNNNRPASTPNPAFRPRTPDNSGQSQSHQSTDAPRPRVNGNQKDRYLRPSLSQHGARPHTTQAAADRSSFSPRRPNPNGNTPSSTQNQQPRQPMARNPRINDSRPNVTRSSNHPPRPAGQSNTGTATPQINRRRFNTQPPRQNFGPAAGASTKNTPIIIGKGSRKLRIIPMGGAGEVGARNMTVFEYGEDIVVVDCGIGFPEKDQPGIDSLIPDVTYLEQRKGNIRGMVFTHGHEDHIGSVAYIWPKLNCPMYAAPLTCGLIQHKLDEAGVTNAPLTVIQPGDKLHFGQISVEAVRLTHSIPDVLGLAIRCPAGLFFYATDWRVEFTPALGKPADWIRVAQLGGEGITALFSDSTNVDRPGYSPSEKSIGEAFDRIFQEAKGRIIVAQFSSQINRIQQVLNSAKKFNRKIAISGRSMETYITIAMKLGYLKIPENMLIDIRKVNTIDPRQLAVLSTGSQGEEYSSLTRISEGEHRHIKLDKTDTVVISASAVPGNEGAVDKMIDNLYKEGANVIHNKVMMDIHVSGHPSRDELKLMIALTQPKFFIPIHGDYHRMVEHGKLAVEMGVEEANVLLMQNGQVLEFDEKGGRISQERVELTDVMIDGLGVGDVGPIVIRERQTIGEEGIVTTFLVVKSKTGEMINSPEIISRGFIYMREAEDLVHKLREEIKRSYLANQKKYGTNWEEIKSAMRDEIGKFIEQATGRTPMVIPVITTV